MRAPIIIILLICFTFSPALAAQAATLPAAHRAIYDLDMVATRSGAQIIDVHGKMFYEWGPSCDAWVTNHRFNLVYEYADSPGMRISSDFTTHELKDGSTFNFSSRRSRDGKLYQDLRGHSNLQEATFTAPDNLRFDLPKGTLFPTAHTLRMLEEMHKGARFYSANIFDGSDEEGPIEVNTFFGEPVNAMQSIKPSDKLDMSLLNTPARRVRMAVFPLDGEEEESDYEMTMVLHDNGIISDMIIDYDDFSVRQSLVALEKINADDCGMPKKKSLPKDKSKP